MKLSKNIMWREGIVPKVIAGTIIIVVLFLLFILVLIFGIEYKINHNYDTIVSEIQAECIRKQGFSVEGTIWYNNGIATECPADTFTLWIGDKLVASRDKYGVVTMYANDGDEISVKEDSFGATYEITYTASLPMKTVGYLWIDDKGLNFIGNMKESEKIFLKRLTQPLIDGLKRAKND